MQNQNGYPIVRAIDVGYGNTKFVKDRYINSSEIGCSIFPSLAPKASSSSFAMSEGFRDKRDTSRVLVAGVEYEVGPDSAMALGGTESGRVLIESYCETETYQALVNGALLRMDVDHIDVLVLGLPMSTWKARKEYLKDAMTGLHQVSADREVLIERCIIAPQPLGGFYDHGMRNGSIRHMKDEVNLVIDPGFWTLDWVLAAGVTPIDQRSGAVNNGGVADLLRAVRDQLAIDFDTSEGEVGSIEKIDHRLRNGEPQRLFGRESERPHREYLKIAQSRAADALRKMMASIGSTGDIDNIILVGGGQHIYADLIREQFPRHEIQIADNPVFSNVRGFQIIGEQVAKNSLRQAA